MNLYEQIRKGLDDVKAAIVESKKLAADLEAAHSLLAEQTSLNGTLAAEVSALKDKLGAAIAQAETLRADAEAKASHIAALEAEKVSAETRAQQLVATHMGGAPLPVSPSTAAEKAGEGDVFAQLNAIQDPQKRGEFYAKHIAPRFTK